MSVFGCTLLAGATPIDGDAAPLEPQLQTNLPVDGAAWVDLIVKEMMNATSIDDARSRAGRVLESLEKSISAQASAEVAEGFHKVSNHLLFPICILM